MLWSGGQIVVNSQKEEISLQTNNFGKRFFDQHQNNLIRKLILVTVFGLLALLVTVSHMNIPQARAAATTHHSAAKPGTALGPDSASSSNISDMINQVFGSYADSAMRIATCESHFDPGATNSMAIGDSHAEGVFQILYPSTWSSTSQAGSSPYDAYANIVAAHEIFARDGNSWREWECQA
jgi:hypothetical protein